MSDRLYLGTDADAGERVELKADRLTTHGVIVGMTGSGKTGLGLVLLEELARAKVPIIAVDPKGDLANLALLLDFDEGSFAPWVEEEGEAAETAAKWRAGVEAAGLSADDVRKLREGTDIRVFTPGSAAGVSVDLLGAFRRPTGPSADDPESRRALVQSTVSGLLGLAGRTPDPVRDPAHVVLSQIVDAAWAAGEDPDLETLILRLVDPPFEKVGVFPVDKFFPPDDRMDIAMTLNAVMASPAFASWQEGAPLNPEELLKRGEKSKVSIFNIAHLDEVQRTFFLSILLGELLAYSRQMPGTSDLRGLVFFDEVAGYLPPHPKNPPTKQPLLTMMKQSRAVGLGVVLSTQNPVDLDYKALSNAGVWILGRLQTQQDRDRVLKGMGRTDLDDRVEALKKREFVLFDAKADGPAVLKSRHALCFLRGPLTRVEIERLKDSPLTSEVTAASPRPANEPAAPPPPKAEDDGLLAAPPGPGEFLDERVVFSKAVGHVFAPHAEPARPDEKIVYRPALYADVALRFDEDRAGFVVDRRERRLWFPLDDRGPGEHIELPLPRSTMLADPVQEARFAPLPAWCDERKELTALKKRVADDIYRTETAGMFVQKKLKMSSRADESRDAFAERVRAVAKEDADEDKAKLAERYQTKADRLEDKYARAQARVADLEGTLRASQTQEVVDIGATIFSMFTGGRGVTASRVSRAARKRSRSSQTAGRIDRAKDALARVQEDMLELQQELEDKLLDIDAKVREAVGDIEDKEVRLEKSDIRVEHFGVLWIPVTRRV
jgi:hypothetical protein